MSLGSLSFALQRTCHVKPPRPIPSACHLPPRRPTEPPPTPLATRSYDPELIATYWQRRPLSVVKRIVQLGSIAGGFFSRLAWDVWRGDTQGKEVERAIELRNIVTSLGPAYIKLGQALSIRPDLLSPAAMRELQKLCDKVPSFPNETAMKLLEQELGGPWTDFYEELGPNPVAAASLGQVRPAESSFRAPCTPRAHGVVSSAQSQTCKTHARSAASSDGRHLTSCFTIPPLTVLPCVAPPSPLASLITGVQGQDQGHRRDRRREGPAALRPGAHDNRPHLHLQPQLFCLCSLRRQARGTLASAHRHLVAPICRFFLMWRALFLFTTHPSPLPLPLCTFLSFPHPHCA